MSTRLWLLFRRARREDCQQGVVLILAVFAVVLLAVLAAAITAAVRVELLASRASLDRMQSLFLAEAGLHRARAILLYEDATIDTLHDPWGLQSESPLDAPQALGDGYYRVRVYDACGQININQADAGTDSPQYQTLNDILVRLTGDSAVAAAVVDWRDEGRMSSLGGDENEYYASLPQPYLPRNGPFQTLGELLLVRGVTPEMFFGVRGEPGLQDLLTVESWSPNTDAKGEQRLNLNEFRNWGMNLAWEEVLKGKLEQAFGMYGRKEIFQQLLDGFTSAGGQYSGLGQLATEANLAPEVIAAIIDWLCVDHAKELSGKVNLNTAPREVLAALPGSSAELAEAIVARRENNPFVSLGEVAELLLAQRDGRAVFAQMIDHLTTKSSSFIIEAMGWTGEGRGFRTLRALVRRLPDNVVVVQQSEEDWPLPPYEQEQVVVARR